MNYLFKIPKTEPKLTKELLLKHNSEETYMEHYLGLPVKKGLFKSPLRVDSNPTASFYRNKQNELIFKDFKGDFYGNFISVVMELYSISYYKALKTIANDFGIIKFEDYEYHPPKIAYSNTKFEEKGGSIIQIERQEFSEKELKWWETFGISKKTLNKFNVFSCKNVFLNNFYFASSSESSPMFGYYGGKNENGELWRIYMPTKRTYRFLSNWNSHVIQGSKQLKSSGDILVITKSLKDVMTFHELGISAIAPNSENLFLTLTQYAKLKQKFKHIFLLYDMDLAGVSNSKKIKRMFPDLQILLIPRKYKCKDMSDFYKKYGLFKSLDLIEKAKKYYIYE